MHLAAKCEHVGESIPIIEKNGFHHCITTILSYSYVFVGFCRSLEPKLLHTHKCSSTSTTLYYEWRMATKRPDLSPQSKRTRWPPMWFPMCCGSSPWPNTHQTSDQETRPPMVSGCAASKHCCMDLNFTFQLHNLMTNTRCSFFWNTSGKKCINMNCKYSGSVTPTEQNQDSSKGTYPFQSSWWTTSVHFWNQQYYGGS